MVRIRLKELKQAGHLGILCGPGDAGSSGASRRRLRSSSGPSAEVWRAVEEIAQAVGVGEPGAQLSDAF
jgi:hypothetical protein